MAATAWAKRIAAVAAAGVTTALVTAAPSGAQSLDLGYRCALNTFGSFDTSVVLDTGAPDSAFAGQPISTTVTVAIIFEDWASNVLQQFGVATIEGTARATIHTGGADVTSDLALPATQVGADTVYALSGSLLVSGSDVTTGLTLSAGDIAVDLVFKTATGSVRLAPDGTCTLDSGQDATIDTMALSKDGTNATVKAADVAKGKLAKAKVRIKGEHGGIAAGKVHAVLYKGTKIIGKDSANLIGGKAVLKFGKLTRTGTYKVKATYASNANFGASRGRTTFNVT